MKEEPNREEILFDEAVQLPTPTARADFLAEACGHDSALSKRIEARIEAVEQAGDTSQHPPVSAGVCSPASKPGSGPSSDMAPPGAEKPGDRVGRYKLLEVIGEGGYGTVYMADQAEPIRRRVALKVIKLGMDTKQVIARFEAERQALALMDHPNIAKVFEAGATDTGRPYFVMELVRGSSITDYCNQNHLSTRERLELFMQVCHAVQHAHQKGIIHRDIKPSNVLVTSQDGAAVPKVIDFGIAKATNSQLLTDKTLFTSFRQFIGTPAYMSPEQAEMSGSDADTRTDIYALGVLLYELLTGHTPFESSDLRQAGFDEMRRLIREQEPLRPSTRLRTLAAADLTMVAKHQRTEPPKLCRLVRGDLDWIVMKCLEKDRARRYETATALAHDVARHLNNEPVTAAAPSPWYGAGKFVRRHRVGLTVAAALVLLLVAGVFVSVGQAVRANRAEQAAVKERAEADKQNLAAQRAEAIAVAERINARAAQRDAEEQKRHAEDARNEAERAGDSARREQETAVKNFKEAEDARQMATNESARADVALKESFNRQANLDEVMGFMLGELSNRLRFIGHIDLLSNVTERVLAHYELLPRENWSEDSLPRLFAAYKNRGLVLAIQGDSSKALEAFTISRQFAEKLASKAPQDTRWQGERSLCHERIGEILEARGDWPKALDEFRQSLSIAQALTNRAPADTRWQEYVLASLVKIGDVRRAQVDKSEALAAYRAAVGIAKGLVNVDTNNAGLMRSLCSSYGKVGSLLLETAGPGKALDPSMEALRIAKRFAEKDPGNPEWQNALAASGDLVGDVLLAGRDTAKALGRYQEALRIRQRMSRTDPGNTEWQRDLVCTYFKYAHALVAYDSKKSKTLRAVRGELKALWDFPRQNLAIAEQLFTPGDNSSKPLAALEEGIKLAQGLAAKDVGNIQWQDDLARIHSFMGDVLLQAGKKESALKEYQEALNIREQLTRQDTNAVYPQYGLALAHANVAVALQHRSRNAEALSAARNAFHIIVTLVSRWPGNLALLEWPGASENNLGARLALDPIHRDDLVAVFERGFEGARSRAFRNPADTKGREEWGCYCSEMAVCQLLAADKEQSVPHAKEALGVWQKLAKAAPANQFYNAQLRQAYVALGVFQLLNRQSDGAMKSTRQGLKLDPPMVECDAIIALGYLCGDQYQEARPILLKNKDYKVGPTGKAFAEEVRDDFCRLRERGLTRVELKKIDKLLAADSLQTSE